MRLNKLREKQVVNVLDGRALGYISDIVLDPATGCIISIVVPGHTGLKCLLRSRSYVISWISICKIGDDVILVEIDSSVCFVSE